MCVQVRKKIRKTVHVFPHFYRRKHRRDTAVGMRLVSYRAVSRRREGSDTSLIIPFMVLTFRTI